MNKGPFINESQNATKEEKHYPFINIVFRFFMNSTITASSNGFFETGAFQCFFKNKKSTEGRFLHRQWKVSRKEWNCKDVDIRSINERRRFAEHAILSKIFQWICGAIVIYCAISCKSEVFLCLRRTLTFENST